MTNTPTPDDKAGEVATPRTDVQIVNIKMDTSGAEYVEHVSLQDHDRIVAELQAQLAQAQNEALERAALKCEEAEESDPGFSGRGYKLSRILRAMLSPTSAEGEG